MAPRPLTPAFHPVMRRLESPVGRALAFVCTVVPVIVLVLSSADVRRWAHKNGPLILTVGCAVLVLLILEVSHLRSIRSVLEADAEAAAMHECATEPMTLSPRQPTQRDLRQFQEILDLWPFDSGMYPWINGAFNAHTWSKRDSDPLINFVHKWKGSFFDDEVVETAFASFFGSVQDLTHWMAQNGGVDSDRTQNDWGDPVYSVVDGDGRKGGWSAYDKLRNEAGEICLRVLEARQALERVGRAQGL